MINPNSQMMLKIAQGDAYAAGVEFIEKNPEIEKEQIRRALEFKSFLQHPFHTDLKPGSYTDDTEMSVANARVLIENDSPFTKLQFAQAYIDEFNRGQKRQGYAGGFYKFLSSISDGYEFLDKIKNDSTQNGAAMRAVPFGVMPDIIEMLEATKIQASVTHDTLEGIFSAKAIALLSHHALYEGKNFDDIVEYMAIYLSDEEFNKYGYIFTNPWDESPVENRADCPISITTVHAVIDLLKRNESLIMTMKRLILWKGDTDSVAAITWGILSAKKHDEKLPNFMYDDLEQGSDKTGVKYLNQINKKLFQKFS